MNSPRPSRNIPPLPNREWTNPPTRSADATAKAATTMIPVISPSISPAPSPGMLA